MSEVRSPLVRGGVLEPGGRWRNWGRSESAHPQYVATVASVDEVIETLAFARDEGLTVKPIGAGHSFTIHQENNLLWTDGDQTVNNGVDVAGTINGEAATGVGQTLTGNSDAANIAGLVVKYTGAATGNAGAVKLTLGIGELFNRTLFTITDARQGYVSYKQESLKNSIADYETQIDQMEARLALKQEQMLNRFKIMELALQKLQTQSSWLSSQLNALTGS